MQQIKRRHQLSYDDAQTIRFAIKNGESMVALAQRYNVKYNTIIHIKNNYYHLMHRQKIDKTHSFTTDEIHDIREKLKNGALILTVAKEYNATYTTIWSILNHQTYKEKPLIDELIAISDLAVLTGFNSVLLKKCCRNDNISIINISGKFYIQKAQAQKYINYATMIPVRQAAKKMNLSSQRLHELKNAGRITTIKLGRRYFVNLEQLRQELQKNSHQRNTHDRNYDLISPKE